MATRAAHLAVLWSFAIVQPLLADLGRSPEFFVARGNTASDILLMAFGLAVLPPLMLALAEALAGLLSDRLAQALHLTLVFVLATAFAIGVLNRVLGAIAPLLLAALACSMAMTVAYQRLQTARSFLTVLAPAPAVFLASFLLFSPVKEIVLPTHAAATGPLVRSTTPVVLAIFDELPTISLMDAHGRIDAASYPSFGRLARTATWYRNATTVGDGTHLAVPSIFSGRRPRSRIPTARRYPQSIFTLLGEGYDLHVLEPITRVCPRRLCGGQQRRDPPERRMRSLISDLALVQAHILLPHELAEGLPPVDRSFEDFGGEDDGVRAPAPRPRGGTLRQPLYGIAGDDRFAQRLRDGERFVRSVGLPNDHPLAYIAHFVVPHVPWRLLPSGHQYPVAGPTLPGSIDRTWTRDPFLVAQATQRHLLQVGYADRLLGRLMSRLRAAGLWDRALVIVTADHGIGLRPGGLRREANRKDFAAIAGVPLFVKRPRKRDRSVADAPVTTLDILPTIAEILRVRHPPAMDGASLRGTRGAWRVPRERSVHGPLRVRRGRGGDPVSVAPGEFARARDAELARQRELFPRGLQSVFAVGPHRRLLGRRVATLGVTTGEGRVQINDGDAFRNVQPRSGVLPVYVSGYFLTAKEEGLPLAIAVNGRIQATAVSYPVRDMTRFSAIIPPTSLRPGANTIEVFAVSGGRLLLLGRAP